MRSRFASTSTRRPPPPPQRYWRGPVFSRFDGTEWTQACAAAARRRFTPQRRRSPSRTRSRWNRSGKPWLFALDLPASLPRLASGARRRTSCAQVADAADARPAAHRARRGFAAAALPPAVAAARSHAAAGDAAAARRDGRRTCGCRGQDARNQPAHARVRRANCASGTRTTPVTSRRAVALPQRAVRLHAVAAAARARPVDAVPVRHPARLLRALRQRVRRAAARRRHPGAGRHRLPGRRDQPAAAAT